MPGLYARPMSSSPRHRPGVWFAVVAITAVVYAFAIPLVPTFLPQERPVDSGELFPISIGSVEGPEGWTLDIRSAAGGSPVFSSDGVTIAVFDGIWFGNSNALVETLAKTLRDRGSDVVQPEVPDDAAGHSREEYRLDYSQGDNTGRMVVVRDDVTVVVIRATGEAAALAGASDVIDRMVETLETGEISENAPPSDPGVRQLADAAWIDRVTGALLAQGGAT